MLLFCLSGALYGLAAALSDGVLRQLMNTRLRPLIAGRYSLSVLSVRKSVQKNAPIVCVHRRVCFFCFCFFFLASLEWRVRHFGAFSGSSQWCLCLFFFLYREPFGSGHSAQSHVQAGALRDHGSSAACRTRVETNQPAEITGEARQLVKVNSGSVPNRILLSSILKTKPTSVQCTCFVLH